MAVPYACSCTATAARSRSSYASWASRISSRSIDADAARHLDVEDRQRHRQPGVTLQRLAEQRAARVVVVVVLAVEAFLVEEEAVDGFDDALDVARALQALPDGLAPVVDLAEVMA